MFNKYNVLSFKHQQLSINQLPNNVSSTHSHIIWPAIAWISCILVVLAVFTDRIASENQLTHRIKDQSGK